jgi:hypothetical protein
VSGARANYNDINLVDDIFVKLVCCIPLDTTFGIKRLLPLATTGNLRLVDWSSGVTRVFGACRASSSNSTPRYWSDIGSPAYWLIYQHSPWLSKQSKESLEVNTQSKESLEVNTRWAEQVTTFCCFVYLAKTTYLNFMVVIICWRGRYAPSITMPGRTVPYVPLLRRLLSRFEFLDVSNKHICLHKRNMLAQYLCVILYVTILLKSTETLPK